MVKDEVLKREGYEVLVKEGGVVKLCYKVLEGGVREGVKDGLICTWSVERAERDKKEREVFVKKAKELLVKPWKVRRVNGARSFIKSEGGEVFVLDEKKIEEDSKWDGFYGIQYSGSDLSVKEVCQAYHALWRIEDSFRVIKSGLRVRPIFHWTARRIKGHLVMCFIAFLLERALEHLVRGVEKCVSLERIRDVLSSLEVSLVETKKGKLYLSSRPSALALKILRIFHISQPSPLSSKSPSGSSSSYDHDDSGT